MTKEEVIRIRTALKQGKGLPLMVFIDNSFENIDESCIGKFTKWDDDHETLWYFTPVVPEVMKPANNGRNITVFAVPYEHIQCMQATNVPVQFIADEIDSMNEQGVGIGEDFKNLIVNTYEKMLDPNNINGTVSYINELVSSNRLDPEAPNARDEYYDYGNGKFRENEKITRETNKYNESNKEHIEKYHQDLKDAGKVLDLADDKSVKHPAQ